jgi:hypothetical protein
VTPSPGDDSPAPLEDDEAAADLEPSSGHSVVVTIVNALMAAMTFGAVASLVMAVSRFVR